MAWRLIACSFLMPLLVTASAPAQDASDAAKESTTVSVSVSETKARPANRLKDATSPYLLQHAHNPVDWYPWGEEAFAKAKAEDKPVFLSVGYSACHWCHVMER